MTRAAHRTALLAVGVLVATGAVIEAPAPAQAVPVQRVSYASGGNYLVVEVLEDDLVHFEAGTGAGPGTGTPLFATAQVGRASFAGPSTFSQTGGTITTAALRVQVNTSTLCATVYDTARTPELLLTTTCGQNLNQAYKGLTLTKASMQNAYGLGAQFRMGGSADGDLVGLQRSSPAAFGNAMLYDTDNGPVANTQIPVLFAAGAGTTSYGVLIDQVYKQDWNLTGDPWTMNTYGDQLRWYVMTGPDLRDVRSDYLDLTGRPPVPPKQAFGLWASEFGYDNWAEIDGTLNGLQAAKFPVDGVMLDVDWFGGVQAGSDNTPMGGMDWDTINFPAPATNIANLRATDGVRVIPIEESYVGRNRPEHATLASAGHLVRAGCATCAPTYLTSNDWWGRGGMVDWTNPGAGQWWHTNQRKPLVDNGVLGHWLDLGEPEMYDGNDWTVGVLPDKHAHADYHNLYNLRWAESVATGYAASGTTNRPFSLTRSGAAGIQRHGVAMWSGDIGTRTTALAAQQNVQLHMSMSGVDYYGSDVGGFRREMLNTDLNELYTQWLANSAWFDIPLRPHTENLCNCFETTPDSIGNVASNRANIRQRYELTPYYYSLAHQANQTGEPVIPPWS